MSIHPHARALRCKINEMKIVGLESRTWLETTKKWVYFSVLVSVLAIVVHSAGQTGGFQHGYWEEPNLYDTWPRFDEITHPLSSMALTAIILNLNLPMTYRKKWIVALNLGMLFGVLWEIMEALAPSGFFQTTARAPYSPLARATRKGIDMNRYARKDVK